MNADKDVVLMPSAENFDGPRVFDASALPMTQRLRAWRAFVSDNLAEADLTYPDPVVPRDAFGGCLIVDRRSNVSIGRVQSAYQRLERTRDHIRRATAETLLLTFVSRGSCQIEQEGRTSQLAPGQFCLYDSRRPYRINVPGELDATVVMVDCCLIEPVQLRRLELASTRTFTSSDPVSGLAFSFWQQLAKHSRGIDTTALDRLARSGFDLLDFGLPPSEPPSRSPEISLRRAKLFIADNFNDPDITPSRIARATGLSPRRLQELFHADGTTMMRAVRDLRLAAAARTLRDPSMSRSTIASVAARHGFGDQSAFCRDFKACYGRPPLAFRRQSLADLAAMTTA